MKRLPFVVVFVLLLLTACTPTVTQLQTSNAVQVNPTLFDGLLVALFTAGTIYLFEKFGLDLRQYAVPVALSTSTFFVGILQGWINVQPVESDPWIILGLRIAAALLAGFGTLRLFSRQPATLLEHGSSQRH
jgi:hypothetical protein